MERITITLPEEMKEYVESQVASGSYGNTSEFIRDLIRQQRKRWAMEKVEELVIEGIRSGPAEPWTVKDVQEIKAALQAQREKRAKK